jgi:head-tail adaptor
MRRSISSAYYAAFHLFVEDFVEHWEFPDERARLGRMFIHKKMCTGFTAKDKKSPTPVENGLQDVSVAFAQLQKDREKADYDGGWRLVETDVRNAIRLAEDIFEGWRKIKDDKVVRYHLLSMFGARLD